MTATLGVTGTDPADSQAFTVSAGRTPCTFSHPTFYTVTNVIVHDADIDVDPRGRLARRTPPDDRGPGRLDALLPPHGKRHPVGGPGVGPSRGENRIVTDSTDTFDIALVNPQGEVMKDAVLLRAAVQLPATGTRRAPAKGVSRVSTESPGTSHSRGECSSQSRKPPLVPGDYYFRVRPSPGSQLPWLISGKDPYVHFMHFFGVQVQGAELLDQNLQRLDAFTIEEPVQAYLRYFGPSAEEPTVALAVSTHNESGGEVTGAPRSRSPAWEHRGRTWLRSSSPHCP
jgi:hypothetical protein